MTREAVDEMLKNYKQTLARHEYLQAQVDILKKALDENKREMISDRVSMSQAITGMPHGTSVGDPVGNLALDIAMGKVTPFVKQVEEEIAKIQGEMQRTEILVSCVGKWLEGLSEREKLAVEQKVFDDQPWAKIVFAFKSQYGEEACSKRSVQRIYDRAMEKIYAMAA